MQTIVFAKSINERFAVFASSFRCESSQQVQRSARVNFAGAPPRQALAGSVVEGIVRLPDLLVGDVVEAPLPSGTSPSGARWCSRWCPSATAGGSRRGRRARPGPPAGSRARELAPAVDRDGAHHHPGEGAHGDPSHLGARLVGRLAAHEVAGPPVDLRHQARPALATGDGVPLPVPDAGPARHDGRALGHLVRDVRPVRALGLARRVAPPAAVPEEAPCRPAARHLPVEVAPGDRATCRRVAHRARGVLPGEPAGDLLGGPPLVAHEARHERPGPGVVQQVLLFTKK